jgi:adenosylcobinamide-GDP ribazoletransferase
VTSTHAAGGLLGALRFLTRVPIPGRDVTHHRAVPWFPVAGALVGALIGGVAAGTVEWLSPTLAAALAVVVGLLVTGAFHEDGLADVADAFGGGWDREQRLSILKDSRHGTYGVAALCGTIVVRVVAGGSLAASVHGQAAVFAGFVAAHTLARAAAVGVLAAVRPADPGAQGLGVAAGRELSRSAVALSMLGALGIAALVSGWWAVPLAGAAAVGAATVAWLAVRKIGGVVGDVLGAVEQIAECLVLVVAAGLASHHTLWWA